MPPPRSGPFCTGHKREQRLATLGMVDVAAGGIVRNQRHIAQAQMLAESFVVRRTRRVLSFLNRPSQRAAEFVALELRDRALIEKVARVQIAVAQEFVQRSVQLIRT